MEYVKISQMAEKWGITARRIRVLCAEGKIPGVIRKGNLYMIPADAQKPVDGRFTNANPYAEIEAKIQSETIDVTLPAKEVPSGSLHPLTQTILELEDE